MRVDFSQPLMSIYGEPLTANDTGAVKVVTLGSASIEALFVVDIEETGAQKFKNYELAKAISVAKDGTLDVTPEDAAHLKLKIGKAYGPAVVGPAYELLNG